MPIVSAVVYTRHGDAFPLSASLAEDPRIEVDGVHPDRFAMVADTADRKEDKSLWRGLADHPDILRIELVLAQFADVLPQEVS